MYESQGAMHNKLKLKFISQIAYEQEIYSKRFGLKARIDSICEFENYFGEKEVYAVELKTGSFHCASYNFQLMLYGLLLKDTYEKASPHNMLVYSQIPENTKLIYWSNKSLTLLLQYRNKLIDMMTKTSLPEELKDKNPNESSNISLDKHTPTTTLEDRRIKTLDKGFDLVKYTPLEEGFQVLISRDATQEMQEAGENYEPSLKIKSYVILRPTGTSIVFTRGCVEKVMYLVTNFESQIRNKPFEHFTIPKLDKYDSCQIQYKIRYKNHPYINLKPKALNGKDCKSYKFEVEKEYSRGKLF